MSTIAITAKKPTASHHYTAAENERTGATDVEIDITIDGVTTATNGVTLYSDPINGGYSAGDSPRDGWVDSKLLSLVDAAFSSHSDRVAVLREIEALAARCIRIGSGASGEIEIDAA